MRTSHEQIDRKHRPVYFGQDARLTKERVAPMRNACEKNNGITTVVANITLGYETKQMSLPKRQEEAASDVQYQ